nr:nodulin [Pisum sativum]
MAKILKCVFVYAIILVFFLLLIAENVHGAKVKCKKNGDCPKLPHMFPIIYRCYQQECTLVRVLDS